MVLYYIEMLILTIAVVGVVRATYTDLRENIIPNRLTYPLVGAGVALNLFMYFHTGDFITSLYGFFGAAIAYGIGVVLYIVGAWAGGDVKLFAALGALLPVAPEPLFSSHTAIIFTDIPIFPLTILMNGIIVAAPVLIVYIISFYTKGESLTVQEIDVPDLDEEMIPAESVWERDGNVESGSSLPEEYEKSYIESSGLDAFGPDRLEEIRGLYQDGRLESIKVKRVFPFAPVFAAGTISGILFGNIYLGLVLLM